MFSDSNKKGSNIFVYFAFCFALVFSLLISCKFKYGLMVIGSESMTSSINYGDLVFFEKVNNKNVINEGDIILFNKNGFIYVHRVYSINDKIIYTKGDNNKNIDSGYIFMDDVIGRVRFNIKYLGYPSLVFNS